MSAAMNWNMDYTSKVIKNPILSNVFNTCFVRHNHCIKQVPLVFVVMSGKRKKEYKKVLKAVKSILPTMERTTTTCRNWCPFHIFLMSISSRPFTSWLDRQPYLNFRKSATTSLTPGSPTYCGLLYLGQPWVN